MTLRTGDKIAIVCSNFNEHVTQALLNGASTTLSQHEIGAESLLISWVPGAFELPLAAMVAAQRSDVRAVICLGAVIRGDTPHFEFVAAAAAQGILRASMDTQKPIVFGVLTTDSVEQAFDRAGGIVGNKGTEAALAVIQMLDVLDKLQEQTG